MELANGGNVEQYMKDLTRQRRKSDLSRKERHKTRVGVESETLRLLSRMEIISFFLDICSGLDHLHHHGFNIRFIDYRFQGLFIEVLLRDSYSCIHPLRLKATKFDLYGCCCDSLHVDLLLKYTETDLESEMYTPHILARSHIHLL